MDQRSASCRSDWRSEIAIDERRRAVENIIDILQRRTSSSLPQEINKIKNNALRFEEKCFSASTSQVDYARRISLKMLQLENDSQGKAGARPLHLIDGNQNHASLSIGPKESSAAKVHGQTMLDTVISETEHQGQLSSMPLLNHSAVLPLSLQDNSLSTTQGSTILTPVMPSISEPSQPILSDGSQNHYLRATSGALKDYVNITPGQGLMTNIHVNAIGQMQEMLWQQTKQNYQSPNSSIYQHHVLPRSLHPLHMQPVQQQRNFVLRGNQLEQLRQPMQRTSSFQIGKTEPSVMQSSSQCNRQQNQLNSTTKSLPSVGGQKQQTMGSQSNISTMHQSQLLGQQMMLNQQYFGVQNNNFGHHHCSHLSRDRSRAMHMQQNQQPVQMKQTKTGYKHEAEGSSPAQSSKPQCLQSQTKSMWHPLMPEIQPQPADVVTQLQASSLQLIMQHHQGSSTLVHSQTTEEQTKFIQSHREQSEVSSATESRTNPTNAGVANMEALQKIKSMKEKYFSELNEFYQEVSRKAEQLFRSGPQSAQCETLGDYKQKVAEITSFKEKLEKCLKFLRVSNCVISPGLKEKIPMYENSILFLLDVYKKHLSWSHGQQQYELLCGQGQFMTEQQVHSFGSSQQICRVSQQNAISNPLSEETLQSSSSCRQPGPDVVQDQNLKLQQHEQMQNLMPDQHMKQQLQQQPMQPAQKQPMVQPLLAHQQRKQQPMPQIPRHQWSRFHQMSEGNELKAARQGSATQSELHQQPNPGASSLTPSPCNYFQTQSPQIYQNSSLSPLSKEGTHSKVIKSPAVVLRPSTPIISSPLSGDSQKLSGVSSPQDSETARHQQISPVPTQDQLLVVLTPGISVSPLLPEFTTSEANEGQRPIMRLIDKLKSVSPTTLGSSFGDVGSVVSMSDSLAASSPGYGARSEVGEDLSLMTQQHLQVKRFLSQDGSSRKKTKRDTTSMSMNTTSPVVSINYSLQNCLGTADLASTTLSSVKRQKTEVSLSITEEIMDINLGLIDMVVNIADDGDEIAAAAVVGEGTVVNCLFTPVAFSADLKSLLSSVPMNQIMPLKLLLPSNYPNVPPMLLEKLPNELNQETKGLSGKARLRFSRALHCLPQPMSLGDMVRAWDMCVREVIIELAKQFGGGSFSSAYGWKNCGSR